MRVSSLSNDRIIKLVSTYFVPTWLSRDHYQKEAHSPEQVALIRAIDDSRRRKKLEGGSVCVYVTKADGEVIASLPVQRASNPTLLTPFLDQLVASEKLTERTKEEQKASAAPAAKVVAQTKDGRVFLVRTRFDSSGPNRGTSRDVVELTRDEWSAFLPKEKGADGESWAVPAATAEKLLRLAYPPLPHWNAKNGKLEEAKLEVKVVAATVKDLVLRVEGNVILLYPHLGRPNDGKVTAKFVGVGRVDAATRALSSLEIVSEEGRYLQHWDGKPRTSPMSIAIEMEP